jgi:hypothetical protein
MELNLYCFPNDPVHVSEFYSQSTGVLQFDVMAEAYAMFCHG